MKHALRTLLCCALLCLGGCIPVEDFGATWDKGTADAALAGTWEDILPEGEKPKEKGGVIIACAEASCTLDTLNPDEKLKKDYKPSTLKTLAAGSYTYLMVREEGKSSGDIIRYSIDKGAFKQYSLNAVKTEALLKDKFPDAKNISRPPCESGNCYLDSIEIKTLDEETVKILGEIPDTVEYWTSEDRYKKR